MRMASHTLLMMQPPCLRDDLKGKEMVLWLVLVKKQPTTNKKTKQNVHLHSQLFSCAYVHTGFWRERRRVLHRSIYH